MIESILELLRIRKVTRNEQTSYADAQQQLAILAITNSTPVDIAFKAASDSKRLRNQQPSNVVMFLQEYFKPEDSVSYCDVNHKISVMGENRSHQIDLRWGIYFNLGQDDGVKDSPCRIAQVRFVERA